MATGKLTALQLKALSQDDVGTILTDGGGLRGRVRRDRSGQIYVHFEYRYRVGTRYRTAKVASWPEKGLLEARIVCRDMKANLAKGIDPIDARKEAILEEQLAQARHTELQKQEIARLAAEEAARRTLRDAVAVWHRVALARRKDGGDSAKRAIEKDIMPSLGDVGLKDIRRPDLVDILFRVVERGAPVMANHLFADLKQFFNFALTREWVDAHPLAGLTKDKIGGRQRERDRYLSRDEIVELDKHLPDARLQRTTELAIWVMLATCCRVGELSGARWEDVDLDAAVWHIPSSNSKNAKEHLIYLSDFALQQFLHLKKITDSSAWCLPARDDTKHIGTKSIAKQIKDRQRSEPLAHRTNLNGALFLSGGSWTPHDLRRTGATMMAELGVMGEVIERCLNHVEQNRLKRIYQRHEHRAEQRQAWQLLGGRIRLLLDAGDEENVVIGRFAAGVES